MSSLGQRLRKARNNANLSLREVEKKLIDLGVEVSYSYLSHLENNRRTNPNLDILKNLAKLYKVPVSYFIAPKQTLEALTPEEQEYFEKILQNEQIKTLLREARGLTPNDLARIIQIAKAWNEGKIPEQK